jgi:hypothetical protein
LPWLSLLGIILRNPRSVLGAVFHTARVFSILQRMAFVVALISTDILSIDAKMYYIQ